MSILDQLAVWFIRPGDLVFDNYYEFSATLWSRLLDSVQRTLSKHNPILLSPVCLPQRSTFVLFRVVDFCGKSTAIFDYYPRRVFDIYLLFLLLLLSSIFVRDCEYFEHLREIHSYNTRNISRLAEPRRRTDIVCQVRIHHTEY